MMALSAVPWIQLVVVGVLAVLTKEYLSLRSLLQDARLSGICERCPEQSADKHGLIGKLQKVHEHQNKELKYQKESQATSDIIQDEGSAVWCHGNDYSDRLCRFRNLCYLPSTELYVFFHTDKTIISGVPSDRHSPALADLSTVRNHNRQLFNYVDLPGDSARQVLSNALYVNQSSIIFKRFNPDNIMHVLHDDLLPLYYTLLMQTSASGQSPFDIQLVLVEGWNPGPYVDLYQLMTLYKPLFLKDIHAAERPVCFKDAFVSISKYTTWYQYGFHEPQGPLPDSIVTAVEVRQFTNYVKTRFDIQEKETHAATEKSDQSKTIVIFTRRYNRLILNEVDLTVALAQELQMKVITLSMETHSLKHIISALSSASVLLSMHGSLLSLAMFLPPGAIIVELFPYAINPNHYTPYKTLAELPGMGILYKAWRNTMLVNTVTHPNRPWDTGGIAHLSTKEQERIMHSSEVPLHLCCRDPEWLFRIYQDTIVEVPEVVALIKNMFKERQVKMASLMEEQHALVCDNISPSWVQNISCSGSSTDREKDPESNSIWLKVTWQPSWNLEYLDAERVEYEVWVQEVGQTEYSAWIMGKTEHLFDTGLKKNSEYNVWIRCLLDSEIIGPFNTEQVICYT